VSRKNGCVEIRACSDGSCDGGLTVNIVWIVVLFLDGVSPPQEVAQPGGGAGHYLSIPAQPGTYQCNLIGFQLDDGAAIEVATAPPCIPLPVPPPDFGVTVQNVSVTPDNGAQPGCLSFELVVAGTPNDGGYGIVYQANGHRTVIGDISAQSGGGCPELTGVSPSVIGISGGELVTATGTPDLTNGVFTASAQGFAGPISVPVFPAGPPSPGSVPLALDTSAALSGPRLLTFPPNDPICPPSSVRFTIQVA